MNFIGGFNKTAVSSKAIQHLTLSGAYSRINKPIKGGPLKHVTEGFRQAFKEQRMRGLVDTTATEAKKAYQAGNRKKAIEHVRTLKKLLPK